MKNLLKGDPYGKMIKIARPANLASSKAQNLIIPSKIDDPFCQIPNSIQGQPFQPVKKCLFWAIGGTLLGPPVGRLRGKIYPNMIFRK